MSSSDDGKIRDVTEYDQDTLQKVYDALWKGGVDTTVINAVIVEMQNAGILFRERAEQADGIGRLVGVLQAEVAEAEKLHAELAEKKIQAEQNFKAAKGGLELCAQYIRELYSAITAVESSVTYEMLVKAP